MKNGFGFLFDDFASQSDEPEISKGFQAKFSNFVKYTTKTSSDPLFKVESSVSKEPNPRFPTFVYGPTMFNL